MFTKEKQTTPSSISEVRFQGNRLTDSIYNQMANCLREKGIIVIPKPLLLSYPEFSTQIELILKNFGKLRIDQKNTSHPLKLIKPINPDVKLSGNSIGALPLHTDGAMSKGNTPHYVAFFHGEVAQSGGTNTYLDMKEVTDKFINKYGVEKLVLLSKSNSVTFKKDNKTIVSSILSINKHHKLAFRIRLQQEGLEFLDSEVEDSWRKLCDTALNSRTLMYNPEPGDIVIFDNHRFCHSRTEMFNPYKARFHYRVWIDYNHFLRNSPEAGIEIKSEFLEKIIIEKYKGSLTENQKESA